MAEAYDGRGECPCHAGQEEKAMERVVNWKTEGRITGIGAEKPGRTRTLSAWEVEELLRDWGAQVVSFTPDNRRHAKTA